jgi:subtilisin family serine protease
VPVEVDLPMSGTRRPGAVGLLAALLTLGLQAGPAGAAPGGDLPALPAAAAADAATDWVVQVDPVARAGVRGALARAGVRPDREFRHAIDGFALTLTPAQARALERVPGVRTVEPDAPVTTSATIQESAPWNLDRLDQPTGTDGRYRYPTSAGTAVRVYVVDTGLRADHAQLAGRVLPGHSTISGQPADQDCSGHGTHVAGTVAGTTHGVAKQALVVPVRVFECTSGETTTTAVVGALDWIIAQHPTGTPGVVNMSLGASKHSGVNAAVATAVSSGLFVAVAAGNAAKDACTTSPASAPTAFTVAASTKSDARAAFSNTGPCVDAFGPGQGIVSAGIESPTDLATSSGTSMAAPHVAGLAAMHLALLPTATPAEVTQALLAGATPAVADPGPDTTNLLVTTAGVPRTGVPRSVQAAFVSGTAATVTWATPRAPLTPLRITGYTVEHRRVGSSSWSRVEVGPAARSALVPGLTTSTGYEVRVRATAEREPTGEPSATAPFTTTGTPTPFTDVPPRHSFFTETSWVATSGISTGYTDGTFRPRGTVSRDAMAAFMYRLSGQPAFTPPATSPFSDVSTRHPFYREITWLAASGVTTGYPDGTFRPKESVNRDAMAAFLYRLAGRPSFTPPTASPFSDVSTRHPFYREITWLAEQGISTGYSDGTFRPRASVSRDAMAAFMYRFDALPRS